MSGCIYLLICLLICVLVQTTELLITEKYTLFLFFRAHQPQVTQLDTTEQFKAWQLCERHWSTCKTGSLYFIC